MCADMQVSIDSIILHSRLTFEGQNERRRHEERTTGEDDCGPSKAELRKKFRHGKLMSLVRRHPPSDPPPEPKGQPEGFEFWRAHSQLRDSQLYMIQVWGVSSVVGIIDSLSLS